MPALTLSTIRKPYRYRGYLTVVPEAVVLEGTLTATPTYPALTLAYTLTAGDEADVLADMEVEIYSSANVFKGRLRVAQGGTISSTSLPVNEFSRGRLDIVSGDKFKVLRSWRIRDRLVAANATFDKDSRVTYTDQNEHIAPVACAGGPWAGFVDAGQSYATLELSAAESYTVDLDSGGAFSVLWDVGDGTITVGTDTDETITVRFPTGSRWVQLTVEDEDNGATSVYYFPVVVHNYTNARPHEVIVSTLDGERTAGWRCSFQLPAGADIEDLPDGALIIYHEDEYYGGVKGSYGHPVSNRSRIKFTGYVTADTITVDVFTNEVSFEAVGPLGILENLPGFSQVLEEVSSPTNWQEYEGLTVYQVIIYILRTGTTLSQLFDIVLRGDDAIYPAIYIQKAVPLQQVHELADGMSWELTCDRTGRLMFSRKLTRLDSTDRNAATTTATLTADDRIRITARREHRGSVNTLLARGFAAGNSPYPMWSKAPGDAPDEAPGEVVIERLIEGNQSTLNDLSGWAYAEQNKRLNGLPAPTIDAELPGGYDCIDFYPEWLKLTVDAANNKRGVGLSAQRGLPERISVIRDASAGSKSITLSWQCETDGAAGIAQPIPVDPNPPNGDFPDIGIEPYPPGWQGLVAGQKNLAVIFKNGRIGVTETFNQPYPTYVVYDLSGTIGTSCLQWVYDARSTVYNTCGWIITSTAIYRITGIGSGSTPSVTLQHTFADSSTLRNADAAYLTDTGLFVVVSSMYPSGSTGNKVIASRNGGQTWGSEGLVKSGAGLSQTPGIMIDPLVPGRVYTFAWASPEIAVFLQQSDDYAQSWTQRSNVFDDDTNGAGLVISPTSSPYAYYGYANLGADSPDPSYEDTNNLFRAELPNVGITDITPIVGSVRFGPDYERARFTISVCPTNADRVLLCGTNKALTSRGVFLITNGTTAPDAAGTNFTTIVSPSGSVEYRRGNLVDETTMFLYGTNDAIAYSDSALAVQDKKGNLSVSSEIIGITGF